MDYWTETGRTIPDAAFCDRCRYMYCVCANRIENDTMHQEPNVDDARAALTTTAARILSIMEEPGDAPHRATIDSLQTLWFALDYESRPEHAQLRDRLGAILDAVDPIG